MLKKADSGDRRSKKNNNLTAFRMKSTITERQNEKAGDYVPDERTR